MLDGVLCKPFNAIFFKNIEYVNCIHDLDSNSRKYDLILDLRGNEQTLMVSLVFLGQHLKTTK